MFLNDWKEGGLQKMLEDFEISENELKGAEILLASYSTYDYEGGAYVLFKKGKKLYEVHASHCSCYCFEQQWEPEETNIESIKHRLSKGDLGMSGEASSFKKELLEIIGNLENSED